MERKKGGKEAEREKERENGERRGSERYEKSMRERDRWGVSG